MTNRCKKCNAYCCRHVAIGIDTPTSEEDFDHIRWYLRHKNIWVSIGLDGSWIVEFKTPCRSIAADYKCADYKNRPQICKEYPGEDNLCEGETGDPSYTELFKNLREFERYLGRKKKDKGS